MIPSAQHDSGRETDPHRLPEAVRFLAEAGRAAPSADNGQPWRFRWGNTFDVYFRQATGEHELLSAEHPATQIALGAVIENLAQAAVAIGLPFDGSAVKAAADQPIAQLTVDTGAAVPHDARSLPLFGRHTNRFPFTSSPLPASLLAWASDQREGSARCLVWEDSEHIRALARLVRQASEARFQTQEIHEWLGQSLRFTSDEVARGDGLDVATLHLPPGGRQMLRATRDWKRMRLFNRFGAYKGFARAEAAAVSKAPALLAILALDTPGSAVAGGRLLERVWIEFNRLGIAMQPYFVITDQLYRLQHGSVPARLIPLVERTKEALDAMLGRDNRRMLILLRVGRPKVQPPRALRLPLGTILSDNRGLSP
jgi:hypothetical protein